MQEQISSALYKLPSATRIIGALHLGLYVLSYPFPHPISLLYGIPYYLIRNLEIWRILTGCVAGNSLVGILPTLLVFLPLSQSIERAHGSARHLLSFIGMGVMVNLTCLSILLALSLALPTYTFRVSFSIWGNITAFACIKFLKEPDAPVRIPYTRFHLKSKYAPFFLLVLQLLLFVGWEALSGLIVGLVCKLYVVSSEYLKYCKLPDKFFICLEEGLVCGCLTALEGFIPA